MARYNDAIAISFNDNDGGIGFTIYPETTYDLERYSKTFGKYRARWIFLKTFWRALIRAEMSYKVKPKRLWVFQAEIPE